MEKIESFKVDHTKLVKGIYLSRCDDNIFTYDIRMKRPNIDKVMTTGIAHTIEHIGATFLRNSMLKDKIIYFGPMGCMTGFYLIVRDLLLIDTIELVYSLMREVVSFEGSIPGATEKECGNYKDMDLEGAKMAANYFLNAADSQIITNFAYPYSKD